MSKLLIAEDEDHIFRMLEFRLKNAGHEIVWAENGQQAIETARSELPDLIIMDVMMPILNGLQALKELKSESTTADIPVVMLTASVQESDIVAGIDAGATDYIKKPFSFPELLARINRILGE